MTISFLPDPAGVSRRGKGGGRVTPSAKPGKKVAGYIGVEMTKQTFAKSVSKAIPVVGAAVSGGLTFEIYRPMAKRLKKHLSGSELTKPTHRDVVVEAEQVHESFVAEHAESRASDGTDVTAEGPRP